MKNETIVFGEIASNEEILASSRKQLMHDGLLSIEDDQYFLTVKGRSQVEKELQRYQNMPEKLVLIAQYFFEQNYYGAD